MANRKEILTAVYAADKLHLEHDSQGRFARGEARVDVYGMISELDIPVMFRPLDNLLGAYVDDPGQGILVTTQRPLPVQRFTAAHELGHATLGHTASLDGDDILARAAFTSRTAGDVREVQANIFATELLTPQWLIAEHMKRQGWNRDSLSRPEIVYQLSLRMGSSYTAMCYALKECSGIDSRTCEQLLGVSPRSIKQQLAAPYSPPTFYGDIWVVTDRDNGLILEGNRLDTVVIRLEEHPSSGYVWSFGELAGVGLAIKRDDRETAQDEHFGGVVFRTVTADAPENGASGHVRLQESRPWQAGEKPLNTFDLELELSGPARAGLLPQQLEALLHAA